uniref:Murein hydrolase activator NlpD n=1 Tax=Candidatus Aschnera chinzeii TaxID=1485666 RepID=A0AAT9G4Z1_9ENTR|nr:MAG: hypothetical protein ACHINZ_4520 [Candidatus Aschnera chinzeii]
MNIFMNFNSLKYICKLKLIFIINTILLINCSSSYKIPAPINNINDKFYFLNEVFNKKSIFKKQILHPANQNRLIIHKVHSNYRSSNNINHVMRNYHKISKGIYTNNVYIVKAGDTLYYIAWITGQDYHELAKKNKIISPYMLNIGQKISIADLTKININRYLKSHKIYNRMQKIRFQEACIKNQNIDSSISLNAKNIDDMKNNFKYKKLHKWQWPTNGKIIKFFSHTLGGNKGIDISGLRGQYIFATTAGKVVYSGNALRGYGNLIIIKHQNDYLSAYAHNDIILVHNQEIVNAGQKIATMGKSGTNKVKLHFEIRYKGKSVDPLCYLLD